jgi:hypothetical protein
MRDFCNTRLFVTLAYHISYVKSFYYIEKTLKYSVFYSIISIKVYSYIGIF